MAEPTASRKDVTRAKLLEVGALQFAEGGYFGTSYNELIAATGLSKGACYHHFKSKQDLALAVYEAKQTELLQKLATPQAPPASALEHLAAVLRARTRAFVADRGFMCLSRLAADFAKDPQLRAKVAAVHQAGIDQFVELLRWGQKSGDLRADIDAEAVARVTFAALVGMTELAGGAEDGAEHDRYTEDLIALLSAALQPTPRRSKAKNSSPTKAGGKS